MNTLKRAVCVEEPGYKDCISYWSSAPDMCKHSGYNFILSRVMVVSSSLNILDEYTKKLRHLVATKTSHLRLSNKKA